MPRSDARPDPYPRIVAEVMDARHPDPLILMRAADAPRGRTGRDADYIVAAPYRVEYRLRGEVGWRSVTVPEGLITDLASVGPLGRILVGRVGSHLEAVIVHDYLYVAWQDLEGGDARAVDRAFADDLMRAVMRRGRVGPVKAWVIYRAVRLFGGAAYRKRDDRRYALRPART